MQISENIIHVWCLNTSSAGVWLDTMQKHLSPDEEVRLNKFRFEQDRERFIIGRGGLRVILGRYLGISPPKIEFEYGPYGKPELKDKGQMNLQFNLSHAKEITLYAITLTRAVGIDIEYITPVGEVFQIAERYFSPEEKKNLESLSAKEYQKLFFKYWVRKEAYLKTRGMGISEELLKFDTASIPDSASKMASVSNSSTGISGWSLMDFILGDGYIAALISEGRIPEVEFLGNPLSQQN